MGQSVPAAILAADIVAARFGHGKMPPFDPHQQADRENEGHLSGNQCAIEEKPPARFH
jgi:hypothetical protein